MYIVVLAIQCMRLSLYSQHQATVSPSMAILSAFTLIRAISLFHITIAYFFLTAPRKIADQNIVYILGESMRLVHTHPTTTTTQHLPLTVCHSPT